MPVTVLYVAWAPFFSGAERALLILVENLDPARYRPVVVIGTEGELESELRSRRMTTAHVPITYTGLRTLPNWIVHVGRLTALARRERAALVHANDVPSFQPAGYAARWLGCRAVTHVRFPDTGTGFRWFLKPGFHHALFVSGDLRNAAIREAPDLFGDRSEVVYDGVRMQEAPDDSARRALRQELGLPADGIVVALTGQVAEVKGIWEFIDAAEMLVRRGVPVSFAVLGDDLKGKGALRREAESTVASRGLTDRVRFLGFLPNAPRLIPAFDIIAVPSHVEHLKAEMQQRQCAALIQSDSWCSMWKLSDAVVSAMQRSAWQRSDALAPHAPDLENAAVRGQRLTAQSLASLVLSEEPKISAPRPRRETAWFERCEQLVALQLAFVLRDIVARTVTCLFAAMLCLTLLTAAHLLYSFNGRNTTLTIDMLAVAATAVVSVWVLVDMERDHILSRLRTTTPGRVDINWDFFKRIAVYGVLPLLVVIASLFPEVGGTLFGWLEPLRKLSSF